MSLSLTWNGETDVDERPWWEHESDPVVIDSPWQESGYRTTEYNDAAGEHRLNPLQVMQAAEAKYTHIRNESLATIDRIRSGALNNRVTAFSGQDTMDMLRRLEQVAGAMLDFQQIVRYGQVDQYRGEGDVDGALSGLADLSSVDSIQCVHADSGICRNVEDLIEEGGIRQTLREIANTQVFYGQATSSQLWDRDYFGTVIFSPKNVAISQYHVLGERDVIYRPDDLDSMLDGRPQIYHRVFVSEWDEYREMGIGAIPLDRAVTAHSSESDLPFVRYARPRISATVRPLSYRVALDEMRMATTEGLTSQTTIYKLKDPTRGELSHLKSVVSNLRGERTKSFVWRDSLTVEQLHPRSIDQLLSGDAVVWATADIFRNLRVGVELTGSTLSTRQMNAEQVNYLIWSMLTQATRVQKRVRDTWLRVFVENYNRSVGWSKRKLSVRDFIFVPTSLDVAYRIKEIVQPLATYGIVSVETAMRMAGLDYEQEIRRIREEWESGLRDQIRPFSSFSQTVQGQGGDDIESISKPGRTPDAANPGMQGE